LEGGGVAEFFPEGAFFVGEGGGGSEVEGDEEVAAVAGFAFGEAAIADAEFLAVFAAWRDAEFDGAVEGGDDDFGAEHGFPWGEGEIVVEVGVAGSEVGVGGVADAEEEIAWRAAADAGAALGGDADATTVGGARGDADLEGLGFALAGLAVEGLEGDGAGGAVHGFFEGDEDVAFDIRATAGAIAWAGWGLGVAVMAGPGEVLLEEVAEAGAGEVEVLVLGFRAAGLPGLRRVRLVGSGVLPVGAELVVLAAFFGIAEDLVGFVDFFEFGFGGGFVGGDVGVVDAGEFAEGLFDFVLGRLPGHAEGGVVVLEFDGHGERRGRGWVDCRS
jgi:hypothetical protein